MQSLNNLGLRVKLLILAGLMALAVGVVVLQTQRTKNAAKNTLSKNEYYDVGSGETVSNPPEKTEDTYGDVANQPVFLGMGALLKNGFSLDQLNAVKQAFLNHSLASSSKISEVSIQVASIKVLPYSSDSDAGKRVLTFQTKLNRDSIYDTRVVLVNLHAIQMTLSQGTTMIFDSGTVNWNQTVAD